MSVLREAMNDAAAPPPTPEQQYRAALNALDEVESRGSFLLDQGRSQIIEDAYRDGSTVFCKNCKGMIKRERWMAHVELWCPMASHIEDEDEEEYEDAMTHEMDEG